MEAHVARSLGSRETQCIQAGGARGRAGGRRQKGLFSSLRADEGPEEVPRGLWDPKEVPQGWVDMPLSRVSSERGR